MTSNLAKKALEHCTNVLDINNPTEIKGFLYGQFCKVWNSRKRNEFLFIFEDKSILFYSPKFNWLVEWTEDQKSEWLKEVTK